MVAFVYRLDFWGTLIDLVGLTVLLSYDIPFLQPYLMRVPWIKRRNEFLATIKSGYAKAIGVDKLERYSVVAMLRKPDIGHFLKLFPDWKKKANSVPQSATVFVYYDSMYRSFDPYVFPSLDSAEDKPVSLATPLRLSTLGIQEDVQIHNLVYTAGFVLMFVGSMLVLAHIWRNA